MIRSSLLRSILMLVSMVLATGFATGCSKKGEPIRIATKPMAEQFILGEMLGLLIERHTDLKVELVKGIGGGTGNIHPAMLANEFDLYPEYTGTAWMYVLKETARLSEEELVRCLEDEYRKRFDFYWVGFYGFSNTYTIAVRSDLAKEKHIRTFSDLATVAPDLTFGANYDFFEREDGFAALENTYGMHFKKNMDMDIGLKFQAVESGKVDSIIAFTTDGLLSVTDVTTLKDDKQLFPSYYCGTVIRGETLKKYPELKDVLLKMQNILTDREMAALNYEVEGKKRNERDVAREFLIRKGLL